MDTPLQPRSDQLPWPALLPLLTLLLLLLPLLYLLTARRKRRAHGAPDRRRAPTRKTNPPASLLLPIPISQPTSQQPAMAVVSVAVDAVVALFSLIMTVSAPLFDSQVVLRASLYPAPLLDIFRWFVAEFDHYIVADPPPFFRGLVWIDLAFLWPVSVANLYGILARRRWSAATSIMAGVHMLTYLSAMFGEMLGSGRATRKLLLLYALFVVFAVASIVRGLCSCSTQATPAGSSPAHPARNWSSNYLNLKNVCKVHCTFSA